MQGPFLGCWIIYQGPFVNIKPKKLIIYLHVLSSHASGIPSLNPSPSIGKKVPKMPKNIHILDHCQGSYSTKELNQIDEAME